ncbi:MAG: ParA family protein [bacterium]|jgi:chromosome partitioning protein|nr:ParA family protein [bacterium]
MPMVMMFNLKGGVAKTTNTVALAEWFAAKGKKVLLIDADHQCMASELLLGEQRLELAEKNRQTLHDLLAAMLSERFAPSSIPSFISKFSTPVKPIRPNLDCLACSHRIDEFSTNMAKAKKGYQSNEAFLQQLNRLRRVFSIWCNRHYDFTLVDCPPSFALQVQFLLGSADALIIPSIPDRLSIRGSLYLLNRMKKRGYTRIRCLGTLWSMVRVQVAKHKEIMRLVQDSLGEYSQMPIPFTTIIPNMGAIADAMDTQTEYKSIKEKYKGESARLFSQLCKEIAERIIEF